MGSAGTGVLLAGILFGISPTNSRKSVWKLSGTRLLTDLVDLSIAVGRIRMIPMKFTIDYCRLE